MITSVATHVTVTSMMALSGSIRNSTRNQSPAVALNQSYTPTTRDAWSGSAPATIDSSHTDASADRPTPAITGQCVAPLSTRDPIAPATTVAAAGSRMISRPRSCSVPSCIIRL